LRRELLDESAGGFYLTTRLLNQKVKFMTPIDRLSDTFAALADPTRRAILARLANGDATVGELGAPFAISAPAISKHLKVLERAGLITRGRDAQWRPCRLQTAPLKEVASYIDDYRKFWNESFDRLTDYLLREAQPSSKKGQSNVTSKRKRR
jgi:DNA-binding transcriptional ArsR family regulator